MPSLLIIYHESINRLILCKDIDKQEHHSYISLQKLNGGDIHIPVHIPVMVISISSQFFLVAIFHTTHMSIQVKGTLVKVYD